MRSNIHCVVGSGPAGVAAAKSLLKSGKKVLMLDAGIQIEPERAEIVKQCSQISHKSWSYEQIAILKNGMSASIQGIPLKRIYGSDFPYRGSEKVINWTNHGTGIIPSLALGGLSNTWGAAILPYRDSDIEEWPINNYDLNSHYKAVTHFTGISAEHDDLSTQFPLHSDRPHALNSSLQAINILNNLKLHKKSLAKRGWIFGKSRLAVHVNNTKERLGCSYCGYCMYGCAYKCIYNSAYTIKELLNNSNFEYKSNIIVETVKERDDQVEVSTITINDQRQKIYTVDRIYLGTGVIPTTKIILKSKQILNQQINFCDSQNFLMPMLMVKGAKRVQKEDLHTLSQIFIEINNSSISSQSIHLQIYTYNDTFSEILKHSLGPLKVLTPLIEERIVIIQGYLHSKDSSRMSAKLENNTLHVKAHNNNATNGIVRRIRNELLKQSYKMGGIILAPFVTIQKPGKSFHYGSTFPMSKHPNGFQSDTLGRTLGFNRVHIIDASVLPNIPATTITFPVMANAHRIASEAAKLDE